MVLFLFLELLRCNFVGSILLEIFMKQLQLIIIIGIIILGAFCYTLLQPKLWEEQIENYFNSKILKGSNWKFQLEELDGNLLNNIIGVGTRINHLDGHSILLAEWSMKINIWKTIIQIPTIESLLIKDLEIKLATSFEENPDSSIKGYGIVPQKIPNFIIKHFNITGFVDIEDQFNSLSFKSEGLVKAVEDNLEVKFGNSSVQDSSLFGELTIDRCSIQSNAEDKNLLVEVSSRWHNTPFNYFLFIDEKQSQDIESHLEFKHFELGSYLPDFPKMNAKFNNLSGKIFFNMGEDDTITQFELWNEKGDTIPGEFNVQFSDEMVAISNAGIRYDLSEINSNIIFNSTGQLGGYCLVEKLNLNDWIEFQSDIVVDGEIYFDGFISDNKIRDWSISSTVIETGLLQEDSLTVSFSGIYSDKLFEFSEPLIAILNEQYVEIDGFMNVHNNQSLLKIKMDDFDLKMLPISYGDDLMEGILTGEIQINGSLYSPNVVIELSAEELKSYLFSSSNNLLKGEIKDPYNLRSGNLQLTFENGQWSNLDLGDGEIDLNINEGDIFINDISASSGDNFIQASGEIIQQEIFFINKLEMAYDDYYMAIPQPLEAKISLDELIVKPFIIHLDDGILEGKVKLGSKVNGRIKLSNINSGFINDFFPQNNLNLSGLVFGEIGFIQAESYPSASFDITMKNGQIFNQTFNDLSISALLNEQTIHIEDFSLTNNNKTGVHFIGKIPLTKGLLSNRIEISSNFTYLNMDIITQFVPDLDRIAGIVSGEFSFDSRYNDPECTFKLNIENGFYDKIRLGKIKGTGFYKNNTLTFDSFSSENDDGYINGSASLPLNIDYTSQEFGKKVINKSIAVEIKGQFTHMDFLTDYISSVDSLRGSVDLDFSINGNWNNLKRNGHISLNNCKLYTLMLEEPFVQLYASGKLQDNLMEINRFQCIKSNKEEDGNNNLFITGSINFNQFFNPSYDIHLKGENIYFKSIADEIEGDVNLELTILGQDTVSIVGDMPINDLTIYKEFKASGISGEEPSAKKRTQIHYDINFPVRESISLVNSQIDAKLNGGLHYTRWGDNVADYNGELFFSEGKFYYYSEIFSISEGFLSFTHKGFNPILDVIAITEIEDEEIQVSFFGPLDQPTLMLSSGSGFSQSDILELLTWGKRFEDQNITYTGLGNQAAAKVEKWLDNQFDRKIMEISRLDRLGILEEIQIEGATGLFDPKNTNSFSIKAGLSKKVSLKYAYHRSFSLTNPSHSVGIEYKVNRYLSLLGDVDENGQIHAKYRLRYSY